MIIEHNKKVQLHNPTPYPSGSKNKPNPTLGKSMTEIRQPLQVQSHLEMPGILVQLGHIQRT